MHSDVAGVGGVGFFLPFYIFFKKNKKDRESPTPPTPLHQQGGEKMDFTKNEIWNQLEKQAFTGKLSCSDFPPAEYKYFTELVSLYKLFNSGIYTAEQSRKKKAKLLAQYRADVNDAQKAHQVYQSWQECIKVSDLLRTKIVKENDIMKKLALCIACISALTKDEVFSKTELRKLECDNK